MVNGERTANVHPSPGICHRLLKFLVNNLMGKGIKHVTLGAVPRESVEIPVETRGRNAGHSVSKRCTKSNGEIVIEFRHIEAKKNGNHSVQDFGSPASLPKKKGQIVNDGGTKTGAKREEQTQPEPARSPHPKKTDPRFRDSHRGSSAATPVQEIGKGKYEKEDVVIIHHRTINGNEAAERQTMSMPLRPDHPMTAPFDINVRAETFIKRTRENISKKYTHDPDHPKTSS